jgi:hypothetical protein
VKPAEKIALISVLTVLGTISYIILITLLLYEEPQGYQPPCRNPNTFQELPPERCGP